MKKSTIPNFGAQLE